jgi:hypothetical protein
MTDTPAPPPPPEDPPPAAEVPAEVPAAAPPPPPATAPTSGADTGPIGQPRGIGFVILMTIITLGIWTLIWSFQNGSELKARTNRGLGGVAFLLLTFFIAPVTMFLMASEVEQLYRREGKEPPITTIWGLWFLLPIIGNLIWYVRIQKSLNEYWVAHGYTPA